MMVEMQFIDKHKMLYLELHRYLAKQEYAPQSEASLINLQTLLLLEIGLLMGCDLDWGTANPSVNLSVCIGKVHFVFVCID